MKHIILIFIILFTASYNYAQQIIIPVDPNTNKTSFTDIVELTNKKDALYKNAQTWITKSYGNYKSVIQLEDKEAGRLIMKGFSKVEDILFDQLFYSITIDLKDNKYRAIVSDLFFAASKYSSDKFQIERLNSVLQKEQLELDELINQLPKESKKSKIDDLKTQINKKQEGINDTKRLAENSKSTINSLLASLKQAMSVKDDF